MYGKVKKNCFNSMSWDKSGSSGRGYRSHYEHWTVELMFCKEDSVENSLRRSRKR